MMEIKFKYYFLLNKEVISTKTFIMDDIEDINFNTMLFLNVDCNKDNYDNMELYRSQYVGLKDRNGVEIYEGDIILIGFSLEKPIYGEVVFELDIFGVPCFCIKEDEDTFHTFFNKDDDERVWFEIKGNKYENRKLTND